jgi:hypothetical protein
MATSKIYQCNYCFKVFTRRFNKERHENERCAKCPHLFQSSESVEEAKTRERGHGLPQQSSEPSSDSDDTSGESDLDSDEIPSSTDEDETEEEDEEEDIDSGPENPWEVLKEKTYSLHQEEFEELMQSLTDEGSNLDQARSTAFKHLLPDLRDTLRSELFKFHMMMKRMNKDNVYKRIVETMHSLEEEDYLPMEAALTAIENRSYLTNRMIRKIPEEWLDDEDDETEEMPSKRARYT